MLKFWAWSGAKVCTSCRSRKMLKNASSSSLSEASIQPRTDRPKFGGMEYGPEGGSTGPISSAQVNGCRLRRPEQSICAVEWSLRLRQVSIGLRFRHFLAGFTIWILNGILPLYSVSFSPLPDSQYEASLCWLQDSSSPAFRQWNKIHWLSILQSSS